MEHYWTERYANQSHHLQTNAVYIHAHDGVLTSHFCCSKCRTSVYWVDLRSGIWLTRALQTVFSMSFFNWSPEQGQEMVSPKFWVYVVVTLAFTLVIICAWIFYNKRATRSRGRDMESGSVFSDGNTSEKGHQHVQASAA